MSGSLFITIDSYAKQRAPEILFKNQQLGKNQIVDRSLGL